MSNVNFEMVVAVAYCDCEARGDRDLDCGFYGSNEDLLLAYASFSSEQQAELDQLVREESRWMGEDSSDSFVEFYS